MNTCGKYILRLAALAIFALLISGCSFRLEMTLVPEQDFHATSSDRD